jgi:hypothetical protein
MWEMKMECILSHLIGSVDSLLLRINDKLGLGMKIKDVSSSPSSISEIKNRLNKRAGGKSNLLIPLDSVLDPGSDSSSPLKDPGWLWTLKDLRNQGTHRNLIPKLVRVSLSDDLNTGTGWSDKTRVSLKTVPQTDREIIPYFEVSIKKTNNLIDDIIKKEPLLAS